jgi:hypothetical protein
VKSVGKSTKSGPMQIQMLQKQLKTFIKNPAKKPTKPKISKNNSVSDRLTDGGFGTSKSNSQTANITIEKIQYSTDREISKNNYASSSKESTSSVKTNTPETKAKKNQSPALSFLLNRSNKPRDNSFGKLSKKDYSIS